MRILFLCFLTLLPLSASAAQRVALVIGMSDYETVVKLDNTLNDALGVSDSLRRVGFDVTTLQDVTIKQLRTAVEAFSFQAETADLALIYFAGHGVEVQGQNS